MEWSWGGVNLGQVREGIRLALGARALPVSRRRRLDGTLAVQVGVAATEPFEAEFLTDSVTAATLEGLVNTTATLTGPGGLSRANMTLERVDVSMLIDLTNVLVSRLRWVPS